MRIQWIIAATGFSTSAMGLFVACSGTSGVGTSPPITGVLLKSNLLAEGKGCGREPTQLFRLRAYASQQGTPVAQTTFDCFADGFFPNLGGGVQAKFDFDVLAFNEVAYRSEGAAIEAADSSAIPSLHPTWITRCHATQHTDVQSIAQCDPLQPASAGRGSMTLPTASFPLPDAGSLPCGQFSEVRATIAGDAGIDGATQSGVCPAPLSFGGLNAPSALRLNVSLFGLDGGAHGTTSCSAALSPGIAVVPTCAPVAF